MKNTVYTVITVLLLLATAQFAAGEDRTFTIRNQSDEPARVSYAYKVRAGGGGGFFGFANPLNYDYLAKGYDTVEGGGGILRLQFPGGAGSLRIEQNGETILPGNTETNLPFFNDFTSSFWQHPTEDHTIYQTSILKRVLPKSSPRDGLERAEYRGFKSWDVDTQTHHELVYNIGGTNGAPIAATAVWRLINSYAPKVDWNEEISAAPFGGTYEPGISDIAFQGNNRVCLGKGAHIFSWNFMTGKAREVDHGDGDDSVTTIAIPRRNNSVVIYGHGGRVLEIRHTDTLDFIDNAIVHDPVNDLSVDDLGDYVVGHTSWRYFTFDLWGANGWQLSRNELHNRDTAASGINPGRENGWPLRYFCFWDDPDLIREKTGRQPRWGNTYITGSAPATPVLDIAVSIFQGSVRIAGLLKNNRIDVWNWSGNRLFTFNSNGTYDDLHPRILEFTPNGELLATATDTEVIFWDMSTEQKAPSSFTPNIGDAPYITALAISDNGKRVAVGSGYRDGKVYIYEWTGGTAPAAPAQEAEPAQPTALLSNYPNPFNPETWIPYQLSDPAEVTVSIYSVDGKLVRTLELGQVPAGVYSEKDRAAYWDGQNEQGEPVASGVYFYTLTAGEFSATRKMVIRK